LAKKTTVAPTLQTASAPTAMPAYSFQQGLQQNRQPPQGQQPPQQPQGQQLQPGQFAPQGQAPQGAQPPQGQQPFAPQGTPPPRKTSAPPHPRNRPAPHPRGHRAAPHHRGNRAAPHRDKIASDRAWGARQTRLRPSTERNVLWYVSTARRAKPRLTGCPAPE